MAQHLATSQMYPSRGQPLRQPTYPNLERTSALRFTKTNTLVVGTADAYACNMLLLRSPVFPVWADCPLPATLITTCINPIAFTSPWVIPDDSAEVSGPPSMTYSNPTYGNIVPPYTGPIIGRWNGLEYVYVPWGMSFLVQLNWTASVSISAATLQLTLDVLNFKNNVLIPTSIVLTNLASATNFTQFTSTGIYGAWVRISSIRRLAGTSVLSATTATITWGPNLDTATGVWQINAVGYRALLPWFEPPELSVSALPYSDTRALGTALRLTNVTKVLNKEGTILAARVPLVAADPWSDGFTSTAFSQAHPSDRYFGALEKGLYAFSFGDSASAQFRPCYTSSAITHPIFNLDGIEYVFMISCFDPNPVRTGSSAGDSTTLAVEASMAIEFRSNSQLFDVDYARHALEDMHKSQTILYKVGAFHPASTPPRFSQAGLTTPGKKPQSQKQSGTKQDRKKSKKEKKKQKPAPKGGEPKDKK